MVQEHSANTWAWKVNQPQRHVPAEDGSAPAVSIADLFVFPFLNDWTYSELLIDLAAHYNADLGQDEFIGCRQLPHESQTEPRLQNASVPPTF